HVRWSDRVVESAVRPPVPRLVAVLAAVAERKAVTDVARLPAAQLSLEARGLPHAAGYVVEATAVGESEGAVGAARASQRGLRIARSRLATFSCARSYC